MTTASPEAPPQRDLAVAGKQDEAGGQFAAILGIRPKTLHEAMEIATLIASSDLVPKDFKGKPANVLLAWEMSAVLGIPPIQGIRNIAVINNRASIWGELGTAIVRNHKLTEYLVMSTPEEVKKTGKAWTRLKRRDQEQVIEYSFSTDDAKTAKLWGKEGPWTQYPYWMLQMRANSFCFKLGASDMLGGLAIAEESGDIIDLTQEGKDKVYALPERAQPVPAAAVPTATAPAAEPAKAVEAEVVNEGAEDRPLATFKVDGVAKTERNGELLFIVRRAGDKAKFVTNLQEVADVAAAAAKAGKEVTVALGRKEKDETHIEEIWPEKAA